MEQQWVTIPLEEFETLHWEIRNGTASLQSLQRGYNRLYAEAKRSELEAEALIALLRIQLDEEHQAFLAEQVATADAIREADALRAENARLVRDWASDRDDRIAEAQGLAGSRNAAIERADALRAEIKRLRDGTIAATLDRAWDDVVAERDALRAEIERLTIIEKCAREAVDRYHEWETNPSVDYESYMDWLAEALDAPQP